MRTGLKHRSLLRFLLLALLADGALFVGVRSRHGDTPREPPLGGRFTKRRPIRQKALLRTVRPSQPTRAVRRMLTTPRSYARARVPKAMAPASADMVHASVNHAMPRAPFTPGVGVPGTGRTASQAVAVEVAGEDDVDLSLELVDVRAMDTGRYRALVVQKPGNQRGIRGYVHLAAVGIRSAMDAAENNESCRKNLQGLTQGAILPPTGVIRPMCGLLTSWPSSWRRSRS